MGRTRDKQQLFVAFTGNVAANVVANLFAAAAIYASGTALGLFPRSPRVIAVALLVMSTVCSVMAGRLTNTLHVDTGALHRMWVIIMFGIAFTTMSVADASVPPVQRRAAIACGAFFLIIGGLMMWRHRTFRPRIKGLHWVELPSKPDGGQ